MKKQLAMLTRCWIGADKLRPLALLLVVLFSTPVRYGLAQGTTVVLSPASGEVAVGATTTVDIFVQDVTGLYGAEVHLTFNPALLEVVDADTTLGGVQIEVGTYLNPYFMAQNVVDQAAGKIDFAVSQGPSDQPVSGSGVIARVTFQGEAAGTSTISFDDVILGDIEGGEIAASTQNGSLTVTTQATPTETSTPEPSPTSTATSTPGPTPTYTATPTVGPTPTPTSTPTPGPTPTASPTPTGNILGYHTVRLGETLFCIGRAYGVDPYAIATRNGILNPNVIHAGHVLAIPDVPASLPPGRVCPRQFNGETPPSGCRWYHTVVLGENLYRISLRYGVSMWTIAEANHILNLHYIRAGQVLCIP
jgi:LysM repeat protein